jgi:hypothetical protein
MLRRLIIALLLTAAPAARAQDYPRTRAVGSSFLPLDHWAYPVFERLAAQGLVQTGMLGLKPWTRVECARLADEAGEVMHRRILEDQRVSESAAGMVAALEQEFAYELGLLEGRRHRTARIESVYARVTTIAGPVLNDALHFGQTLPADFGRPFRRGVNAIAGGAVRLEAGPMAVHLQAEYQHAPAAPALPQSLLNLMGQMDFNRPPLTSAPFAAINRPNLLDTYVAINWRNWQVSAGRQSLSWGPGAGESLLLSNNAQGLDMVRFTRTVPSRLPGFLKWLGPVRNDIFVSRLEGHTDVPRPYIYAHKTAIKPHPRFELGFGRTTLVGGGRFPLTWRTLFQSYFGIRDNSIGTLPGDSRTGLDFTWRLPGLSDSVVLYAELYQDDEPAYFINPQKGVVRAGLFVSRLPGLSKWDLRLEGASSESTFADGFGKRNYLNFQYRDGYHNRGTLMGNPVGRFGRSFQVWTRYWFSPRSSFEGRFKHSTVNPDFVPGGAVWEDYSVGHRYQARHGLYVKSFLQAEHIRKFPVLFPGVRSNVTVAVEIGVTPGEQEPGRARSSN